MACGMGEWVVPLMLLARGAKVVGGLAGYFSYLGRLSAWPLSWLGAWIRFMA